MDVLGEQDQPRHPILIRRIPLRRVAEIAVVGRFHRSRSETEERFCLLGDEIETGEHPQDDIAEDLGPADPHEGQLTLETRGRGPHRRQQQIEQGLPALVQTRSSGEGRFDLLDATRVGGLIPETAVVEELAVRRKGGVGVGEPEEGQLFEDDLAIRSPVGDAVKIVLDRDLTAVDRNRRELVDKGRQDPGQLLRPEIILELGQGFGHERRAHPLAVSSENHVEHLVDEPHGVDLARLDRLLGMGFQIAVPVHPVGKYPWRPESRQKSRCPSNRRARNQNRIDHGLDARRGIHSAPVANQKFSSFGRDDTAKTPIGEPMDRVWAFSGE